jgi:hypothetical protein
MPCNGTQLTGVAEPVNAGRCRALERATTQNNLGIALGTLWTRESGTARWEEPVSDIKIQDGSRAPGGLGGTGSGEDGVATQGSKLRELVRWERRCPTTWQTATKLRNFSCTAPLFIGRTASLFEQAGLEPSSHCPGQPLGREATLPPLERIKPGTAARPRARHALEAVGPEDGGNADSRSWRGSNNGPLQRACRHLSVRRRSQRVVTELQADKRGPRQVRQQVPNRSAA